MESYFWNLNTNDFEPINADEINLGDYEPVRTLDGRVVYIDRVTDIYGETIKKAEEVLFRLGNEVASRYGAEIARNPLLDTADRENYVKSITRGLRGYHVFFELNRDKRRNPEHFIDIHEMIKDLICERDVEMPYGNISNAFCRTLKRKFKEADLGEICRLYDINVVALNAMEVGDVVRVFSKAFNVAGAAFVLARIISKDGITVAREGVSESVGVEHAELEVLRRISRVASKSGDQVEIISGVMNIVNWLEGESKPTTHAELRDEIIKWLQPLGYFARQMTPEENKAYREEKRS